jgi:hypothetical protein
MKIVVIYGKKMVKIFHRPHTSTSITWSVNQPALHFRPEAFPGICPCQQAHVPGIQDVKFFLLAPDVTHDGFGLWQRADMIFFPGNTEQRTGYL